jgi:predicted nucleic acid-binding protein
MSIYVDTSAIIAVMDAADRRNPAATRTWTDLLARREELVMSSYAVAEAVTVLQRRFDMNGVRIFLEDILPLMSVEWVTADAHAAASALLLAGSSKSGPSLADCSGFEAIGRHKIRDVFAYDKHFENREFHLIGQGT